jgi:cbb3-type cytochrome oxidase subunit 3
MMRAVMEGAGLTFWPVLSLTMFTLALIGLLAWLYRSGAKGFYRDMARMALDEGGARSAGEAGGRQHARQG